LHNTCVDEATFSSSQVHAEHGEQRGTIGYVGVALGAALPTIWNNGGEGFQLGVRLGAIFDAVQLQIEASPLTTMYVNIWNGPFTSFDVVATAAYFIPLNDFTSWIIRVGGGGGGIVGFGSPYDTSPQAVIPFGEMRLDVFGVAIRTSKHLLVEINVPSFRVLVLASGPGYAGIGDSNLMWQWVTSVALNYVF
jgi:hypothetical protein